MSIHGEAMISLVALQIHWDTPSGDDPFWHDQHQARQSFEGWNGKDFKPGSCQEELLSPELTVETPKSPAIRSAASVAYTKGKQVRTKKTWHISALNDWRFSHGQHPQWWDRVLQTSASPGNSWLIQKRGRWTNGPTDIFIASLGLHLIIPRVPWRCWRPAATSPSPPHCAHRSGDSEAAGACLVTWTCQPHDLMYFF